MPPDNFADADRPRDTATIRPPPSFERVQIALNKMAHELDATMANLQQQARRTQWLERQIREQLLEPLDALGAALREDDLATIPATVQTIQSMAETNVRPAFGDVDHLYETMTAPARDFARAVRSARVDLKPLLAAAANPALTASDFEALLDRLDRVPDDSGAGDGLAHAGLGVGAWAEERGLDVGTALDVLLRFLLCATISIQYMQGKTLERIADDVADLRGVAVEQVEHPPVTGPEAAAGSEAADPDSAAADSTGT